MNGRDRLQPMQWVILALILILAAGLRLWKIDGQSMSADELWTLEVCAGRAQAHLHFPSDRLMSPRRATTLDGAGAVWSVSLHMGADVHPPLYFVLLRLWEDCFGQSDAACRALSALAGVAGVLVIFDVGRWLAGSAAGLWAAFLMAVAQPEIVYSQDARPYALMGVLVLLAADAMCRIIKLGVNRGRLAGLACAVAAACLTHYFVLPFIAGLLVYGLLRMRGSQRRQVLFTISFSVIAVALAWGWQARRQIQAGQQSNMYWYVDQESNHWKATLARLSVLPLRYLAEPPKTAAISAALAGAIFVFPWFLCRRRPELLLPLLWLISTPIAIAALDLMRGTLQLDSVKYTLASAPAVYLLLALLPPPGKGRWILPAAAALACIVGLGQTYEPIKNDFRGAARAWEKAALPSEPLLIAYGGWDPTFGGYLYLGIEHYAVRQPQCVAFLDSPPSPDLNQVLSEKGKCWLLAIWGADPNRIVPGWICRRVAGAPGTYALYELRPRRTVPEL